MHIDFKRKIVKSGTIVIVRVGEHIRGGEPYSVSMGRECVRWYLKKILSLAPSSVFQFYFHNEEMQISFPIFFWFPAFLA